MNKSQTNKAALRAGLIGRSQHFKTAAVNVDGVTVLIEHDKRSGLGSRKARRRIAKLLKQKANIKRA